MEELASQLLLLLTKPRICRLLLVDTRSEKELVCMPVPASALIGIKNCVPGA